METAGLAVAKCNVKECKQLKKQNYSRLTSMTYSGSIHESRLAPKTNICKWWVPPHLPNAVHLFKYPANKSNVTDDKFSLTEQIFNTLNRMHLIV